MLAIGSRLLSKQQGLQSSEPAVKSRAALVAICAIASLAVAGCAHQRLDIDRSALTPALSDLYERAKLGDRSAQYHLALAFANGLGTPQDCKIARALMQQAAAAKGGRIWVYSPPVGNGTSGRVIPIDRGPVQHGLPEAKAALGNADFCPG